MFSIGNIPFGHAFSSDAVKFRARSFPDRTEQDQLGESVFLYEKFDDLADWDVRDQGNRGTCTAFAVAAAEELNYFLKYGTFTSYSVEYLYAAARAVDLNQIIPGVPDEKKKQLEDTGATFIAQYISALQKGALVDESKAPYDPRKPINHVQQNFDGQTEKEAADSALKAVDFVHDIISMEFDGNLDAGNPWTKKVNDSRRPSEIIYAALDGGSPVVAGFEIPTLIGLDSWFGPRAWMYGDVVYPSETGMASLKRAGGHAVCIIGFERNAADQDGPIGHFLCRNSLGKYRFARHCDLDDHPPIAPAPGYGWISADDVDRFCVEYLYQTMLLA